MPSSRDDAETSAIHAAYQEQIQALFKVLVNNIIDEPIFPPNGSAESC